MRPETFETETRKNGSRDEPRDRNQVSRLHHWWLFIYAVWFYSNHTRTVARKFSIGGFAVLLETFRLCGGLEIIKLTKTPLIYSVSRFNLGGLSSPKPPHDDGTESYPVSYYSPMINKYKFRIDRVENWT